MKKVLVTADDIGVLDAIDKGAKTALKNGWINSIAVMTNRPEQLKAEGWQKFLKNNKRKDHTKSLYQSAYLGLHFTIFSGKPLTPKAKKNIPELVDSKGFFRQADEYTHKRYNKPAMVIKVRDELQRQFDEFVKVFGKKPDYLTSHFDVLVFNKRFFKLMLEFAKKHNMGIRSHDFVPSWKKSAYNANYLPTKLPSSRRLDKWYKELGIKVHHPQRNFVNHFGPLPGFKVRDYQAQIETKQERLADGMKEFLSSKDDLWEVTIHLIESKHNTQAKFLEVYSDFSEKYPGVEVVGFDGRKAEFLSLKTHCPWLNSKKLQLGGK